MRTLLAALALMLLAGVDPPTPAAAASGAETVTIPFAPPEGQELRYRSERRSVRVQPGQPPVELAQAATSGFRFARAGSGGWVLRIEAGREEISGTGPEAALAPMRALARALPPPVLEVTVDPAGDLTDIANADSLLASVRQAIDRVRAEPAMAEFRTFFDVIAATYGSMSRPAFVEQSLEGLGFAFGWAAAAELPLETPLPVTLPMRVEMLGGAETEAEMTVTLARLSPDRVRVTTNAAVDIARLAPALDALVERMLAQVPDRPRVAQAEEAKAREGMRAMFREASQDQETIVDLDLETGLPVSGTQTKRVRTPSPEGMVERIDTWTLSLIP